MTTNYPPSPLVDLSQKMQQWADSWVQDIVDSMHKSFDPFYKAIEQASKSWEEASKRWARAHAIVCTELPKRGWYLTGEEPITLFEELAHYIERKEWVKIDEILLKQAVDLRIDNGAFRDWLVQEEVPEHCIDRILLVLENRETGNHEVATIVGVTVLDELCRHLYDGRDFTTKRNKQPRPQLACSTTNSMRAPSAFAKSFVETFGLIHQEVDTSRLSDENYFNRHAILHGLMRRKYGPKDSAKVFMLLMFLVFGLDNTEVTSNAQ